MILVVRDFGRVLFLRMMIPCSFALSKSEKNLMVLSNRCCCRMFDRDMIYLEFIFG